MGTLAWSAAEMAVKDVKASMVEDLRSAAAAATAVSSSDAIASAAEEVKKSGGDRKSVGQVWVQDEKADEDEEEDDDAIVVERGGVRRIGWMGHDLDALVPAEQVCGGEGAVRWLGLF